MPQSKQATPCGRISMRSLAGSRMRSLSVHEFSRSSQAFEETREPSPEAVARRVDIVAFTRVPRSILYHLFSFEFLFAMFILSGRYKANPTFAGFFPIDPTILFFALSVAVGIVILFREGPYKPGLDVAVFFMAYAAWTVISFLWTPSEDVAMERMRNLITLNFWSFAGAAIIIASKRIRVYRFMMFTTIVGAILALEWVMNTGTFTAQGFLEDREYGGTARAIAAAALVCFVAILYLPKFRIGWMVYVALFIFLMYSLLIVGSRGPMIGLFLVAGTIPVLVGMRLERRSLRVQQSVVWCMVLIAMGVVAIGFLLATGRVTWTLARMSNLANMATGEGSDASAVARIEYVVGALYYWSRTWATILFGTGIGSFPILHHTIENTSSMPHNIVIEVLMEGGFVGLMLFLLFMIVCFRKINLSRLRSEPIFFLNVMLLIYWIFYGVTSGALSSIFQILPYFGLLMMRPAAEELASLGSVGGEEEDERFPIQTELPSGAAG
jgi:O-antigen ligase